MESQVHTPPRLLIGSSLLFWGAITGNAVLGLVAAILVESANWIRFRWEFGDSACARAWRISMILMLIAGSLIWLDGDSSTRYTALPGLMIWMPLLLFPLQFVQSYGTRDRMALNSFSFFSELHRQRNRRLGLSDSVINFNFGNLYLVAVITATSLGTHAHDKIFFPGLVLLVGWLVFSRVSIRPVAFCGLLLVAGAIGMAGQIGLRKAYQWVNNMGSDGGYPSTDPTVNKTAIGSLGKLKQSSEMLWRLKPAEGRNAPRLIRLATYNRYLGVAWKNQLPEEFREEENLFRDLTVIGTVNDQPRFRTGGETIGEDILRELPLFSIRGAAEAGEPLPLPGDAATLQEFDLDGIEINPLGTVRIFPKKSIISGSVRWKDGATPDAAPWPEYDLEIPEIEQEIVEQVVADLALEDFPTAAAKVARIRQWFSSEFDYTRYLSIRPPLNTRPSAVGIFLTESKRGHCEYFATAATLLLREAGVPARYCVGYSVMERDFDRAEFVIRGIHGHAWSRYWDGARWVDFDATPAGWLAMETGGEKKSQWLADTYQRLKEDFFLWRNRPKNRVAATAVMWLIGLSVLAFVLKRLWKSRIVVRKESPNPYSNSPTPRTPLHDLESPVRRILGDRPQGETFPMWLARLPGASIPDDRLSEAISLHQRLRFDPDPSLPGDHEQLSNLAKDLERRLRRSGAAPDTHGSYTSAHQDL